MVWAKQIPVGKELYEMAVAAIIDRDDGQFLIFMNRAHWDEIQSPLGERVARFKARLEAVLPPGSQWEWFWVD